MSKSGLGLGLCSNSKDLGRFHTSQFPFHDFEIEPWADWPFVRCNTIQSFSSHKDKAPESRSDVSSSGRSQWNASRVGKLSPFGFGPAEFDLTSSSSAHYCNGNCQYSTATPSTRYPKPRKTLRDGRHQESSKRLPFDTHRFAGEANYTCLWIHDLIFS